MCGFLGLFGPSANQLTRQVGEALKVIAHRGPDAVGQYVSLNGDCVLGHVRLSILDLSDSANQPMIRQSGVLVYNGEIYNHQTLRQKLKSAFSTHCDTETLLFGLQEQGHTFLTQLEGMFAGAFYDESTRTLTLFRDSLGIKPIYYYQLPDSTVLFASEIKAIHMLLKDYHPILCKDTLGLYMTFENYPQRVSLYRGITLLEPGDVLTLSWQPAMQNVTLHRSVFNYCSLQSATSCPSYADIVEQTRTRITQSVQSHLQSDVPLGVYLSGGLDSSLVATIAAQDSKQLLGFTGYFETPDPFYDERHYSRLVAQNAGIELHEIPIGPADFITHFDDVVWALDEPRMGMGAFSQYCVAMEAAKYRKVILAGHGGDELFCGYPLFKAFWLLSAGGVNKPTLDCLRSIKLKEWPWMIDLGFGMLKTRKVRFAPELYPQPSRFPIDSRLGESFVQPKSSNPLDQLTDYYRDTYLPGLLLVEDKISMAHSLETRVPLWNQALVAWARGIPVNHKLPKGQLKGLLKEAARGIVPDELFLAPKRGFPTPLRLWFRNELRDVVKTRLLDTDTFLHQLIPKSEIHTLLNSHCTQRLPFALDERRAHRIWILLCLESWIRQYRVALPEESVEVSLR